MQSISKMSVGAIIVPTGQAIAPTQPHPSFARTESTDGGLCNLTDTFSFVRPYAVHWNMLLPFRVLSNNIMVILNKIRKGN
jgi:hypothetical protein